MHCYFSIFTFIAFKWNILFYLFFSRTIKLFHLRVLSNVMAFSCTKWHRNEYPTPVYSEKIVSFFYIIYTKYKYNHVLKCTHSIHLYPSALSRSVKTKVTLQFSNLENKRRGWCAHSVCICIRGANAQWGPTVLLSIAR